MSQVDHNRICSSIDSLDYDHLLFFMILTFLPEFPVVRYVRWPA